MLMITTTENETHHTSYKKFNKGN